MKIIEIDDVKYQVIKELTTDNPDFINRLSDLYKDRYNDFVLIKTKPRNGVVEMEARHLICRRIGDADFEEISDTDAIEG